MFDQCQKKSSELQMHPEPLKFRLLKSLNLFDILLQKFLHPSNKSPYTFERRYLTFVQFSRTHIKQIEASEQLHHLKITINEDTFQSAKNNVTSIQKQAQQQNCRIPILHFARSLRKYSESDLIVYCHGSGSTLNNVFNFGLNVSIRYGVGFMSFDFRGEGESQGKFQSYQEDLNIVLAYALKIGYKLNRIIVMGYSIGSFPVLKLSSRIKICKILISPVCGLTSFIEGTTHQYQNQKYDNIHYSKISKGRTIIIHAQNQMIPIQHSRKIAENLLVENKTHQIQFFQVSGYDHKTIPHFVTSQEAKKIFKEFLKKFSEERKEKMEECFVGEPFERLMKKIGEKIVIEQSKKNANK